MLLLNTCISLLVVIFLETPLMAETSCEGRVVGYLRSWSGDDISRQKMASLTHVIFAFFHLAENGTLSVGEGFDNFEGYSGRKLKRLFDSNSNTTAPKILFAIGGWGNSKFLSKLSGTDGSRKALASEILRIIHKYNFDGVDIDWEYPVSGGHHKGHPDDKVNFVKLLQEIRRQFDEKKLLLTPKKMLSVATSAGSSQIEVSFNMEEIMKIVDFVNIMTYDYYGEWNELTGPCAPLYMNENGMSRTSVSMTVDSNIKEHYCKYNDLGKFNLGVAFYGRYWNNVEGQKPGLFSIARKNQKGKVDGGSISYKDIRQSREWDLSKAKFDDETRTPFIHQNGKLLTYENEASIREKVEYSRVKGLGGVMIWAVDQDDNDNSLLEAVRGVRCGHPQESPPFNCDSNLRMDDNEDQVNSYNPVSINVALEVFDSNGRKVSIKCGVRDPSSHILKSALEAFGVDLSLINHFGLFLAHNRKPLEKRYDGFDIIVKRCLKNFENPYVSMQLLNQKLAANGIFHKLVIRKVIYDPAIEESLLFDNGTLNLLYNQALNEFLNNRMDCDDQTKLSLREYAEEGEKISFLRLCHLQPTYGYEHLEDVETNYPHPNSLSSIKIGRRELILSVKDRDTEAVIESTTFRTTRIRVWKIEYNFTAEKQHSYVLKFEYLMPPNDFRWIDINSSQAVTISLFLQSMGTEILLETKNNKLLLECDDLCKTSANALEHIKENSSLIHNSLALNEQGVDRYESFEDVVGWMADGIQMTNRFSSVLD
uniref:Glyco_18 domain-containing protein n=1 Tax=Rhabditophanes sp. KR3021 TaxID=114890 RepID=A0AC35U2F2_9BILA